MLKDWLPYVIPQLQPWVSTVDIDTGTMSMESIHAELADTTYGIVCTTSENQAKPWINYEAGALWKSVGSKSHVAPLLIDIEREAVTSPLRNLQSRVLTVPAQRRAEMKMLIDSLNKAMDNSMPQPLLDELFDNQWHKMEANLLQLEDNVYAYKPEMSKVERRLEDIFQVVQKMSIDRGRTGSETSAASYEKIINSSLVSRGIDDRAHVVRIKKNHFEVYSRKPIPGEIKRQVSERNTMAPGWTDFDYYVAIPEDIESDGHNLL